MFGSGPPFLVPEVVQTSEMDCGPAALACLLNGLGVPVSYGRLREACQTDVDGTSIDTIEDIANACGLEAEQLLVPVDHVAVPEAGTLPSIVLTRTDSGIPHFVLAWRRLGPLLQVMDPAMGRRWVKASRFIHEVYRHEMPLPAAAWTQWARSDELERPLRERLGHLGIDSESAGRLLREAGDQDGWQGFAALDGAARLTASLAAARAVGKGKIAERLLRHLLDDPALIPRGFLFAREAEESEKVQVRGAVVLRARKPEGRRSQGQELPPELTSALVSPPERPTRDLIELLRGGGTIRLLLLALAALAAGLSVVVEGLLLWRIIQGEGSVPVLLLIAGGLLALEVAVMAGAFGVGRRVENRLRTALDDALPRLPDRYLSSRSTSDLAERAQRLHTLRLLPGLGVSILGSAGEVIGLAAAITWLDPGSALFAALGAAVSVGLPLVAQPVLAERDQRVRNHAGSMARLTLDTLIGLVAIRAHHAGRQLARQHGDLLEYWARSSRASYRALLTVDALQMVAGLVCAVLLIFNASGRVNGEVLLLLAYWSLALPLAGHALGLSTRQYPLMRNVALRFFEPLRALELSAAPPAEMPPLDPPSGSGAGVNVEGVRVVLAGQAVLEEIDLEISPGEHVAVVGRSGAGKSTLAGLLLGWHQPAEGRVIVDGRPLTPATQQWAREFTAWVDPVVQIWNESLDNNLDYGNWGPAPLDRQKLMNVTGLNRVIESLPSPGTPLGEGGGLVSGGEGQRVRLARALLRPDVRLVILDEPLRGLDRRQRSELLAYCRKCWRLATLLCITHDVSETASFDRVIVVDGGRVVEDGPPTQLNADPSSLYRALREAEERVEEQLWNSVEWRRIRIADGALLEQAAGSKAVI